MKLSTKYFIDKLFGKPLLLGLNLAAFALGKLLRRNHELVGTRTIIVCKLMGLGSIVQITPLLTALHEGFPGSRIVFLTRQQIREYCDRLNVIDETLVIDDSTLSSLATSLLGCLRRMLAMKSDLFINLEIYSHIGALLAVTSCARNRLGYYLTPGEQGAWGSYTHLVYFNRNAPINEVYLQAARCLGLSVLNNRLLAPRIENDDIAGLREKLRFFGASEQPYVVINPNSSELSHERRWPASDFAETLALLRATHPHLQFFIIGGKGEEATASLVLAPLPANFVPKPIDLSGKLTLPELMVLLRGAKALLTNDSGPMHLAFSFDVPTVALFGPVSPTHYGGLADPRRILLYRHLYCSPCVHHFLEAPCGGDNQCMKLIRPQEVHDALSKLLAGESVTGAADDTCYQTNQIVFGAHRRGEHHGAS